LSRRTTFRIAWSLCGLTLVLIACALVLAVQNRYPVSELYFLMTEVSAALVGALIASRQPRNPVGWFIIGHALCFTLGELGRQYAIYGVLTNPGSLPLAGAVASLAYWAWFPGLMLMIVFLPLYFPDGRLLSPRWRPVAGLAVFVAVLLTALAVVRPGGYETRGIPNPLGIEGLNDLGFLSGALEVLLPGLGVLVGLLAVGSLVARFWRSRGVERQQMKWFVYAAVLFISLSVLKQILGVRVPPIVDEISFVVTLQALWVAIGFAVLNYRLYDVDVVVNRTLVYTVLTTVLALLYFGSIALLQAVLIALTGQGAQLAVVASTLLIAALFNPIRHRTQDLVDRRFYRNKYDAEQVLAAFSDKLRDETDLERLSEDLLVVVRETVQPEHAGLWLRERSREDVRA
jgi:hypothetical protein